MYIIIIVPFLGFEGKKKKCNKSNDVIENTYSKIVSASELNIYTTTTKLISIWAYLHFSKYYSNTVKKIFKNNVGTGLNNFK